MGADNPQGGPLGGRGWSPGQAQAAATRLPLEPQGPCASFLSSPQPAHSSSRKPSKGGVRLHLHLPDPWARHQGLGLFPCVRTTAQNRRWGGRWICCHREQRAFHGAALGAGGRQDAPVPPPVYLGNKGTQSPKCSYDWQVPETLPHRACTWQAPSYVSFDAHRCPGMRRHGNFHGASCC